MARRPRSSRAVEPLTPPLVELCVRGVPVSAQAHNRKRLRAWKDRVAEAARRACGPEFHILTADVELRVTHYCEFAFGDADNLLKPIQDALEGVVYQNDRHVKDALSNRRDINGEFRVRYMSPLLALAFSEGEEFVHIRISLSPSKEELG